MHLTLYLLASLFKSERKHTYRTSVSQTMLQWAKIDRYERRISVRFSVESASLSCSTIENISSILLKFNGTGEIMKFTKWKSIRLHVSNALSIFSAYWKIENDESLKHCLNWWICARKNRREDYLQIPNCEYTETAIIVGLHSIRNSIFVP